MAQNELERLREILAGGGQGPLACDVSRLAANLETVNALARLQLAAGRRGRSIALTGASPGLDDLIELCGLADVLAASPASPADLLPASPADLLPSGRADLVPGATPPEGGRGGRTGGTDASCP